MKIIFNKNILKINIILIILFCFSFQQCERQGLNKIIKSGKLTVITDNNANCYYSYKNQPMGLEYELAKGFADFIKVELEIITPDWQKMNSILKKKSSRYYCSQFNNY